MHSQTQCNTEQSKVISLKNVQQSVFSSVWINIVAFLIVSAIQSRALFEVVSLTNVEQC